VFDIYFILSKKVMIIVIVHNEETQEIATNLQKVLHVSEIITETELCETVSRNPHSIIFDIRIGLASNLVLSTFVEQQSLWQQLCSYTNGKFVEADKENNIISMCRYIKPIALLEFPSHKDNTEIIKKIGEYFDDV